MSTALILIITTALAAVSTTSIMIKLDSIEKNILNEVAFRQERVSSKLDKVKEEITEVIDDTDQVQANDLADILDRLDKLPQEFKESIIKQLIVPTLANRKGI